MADPVKMYTPAEILTEIAGLKCARMKTAASMLEFLIDKNERARDAFLVKYAHNRAIDICTQIYIFNTKLNDNGGDFIAKMFQDLKL
jgi:hypothetical protein